MNFSEFKLHENLISAIDKMGFTECTPIQEATMPHILEGGDIAGLAQTGTGKTAAFLLPLIHRILTSSDSEPAAEQTSASATPEANSETAESSAETAEDKSSGGSKPFENWKSREFVLVLVPTRELAEQVLDNFKKFAADTDLKAVAVYGGTSYDTQKQAFAKGVQFVFATPGRLIDLYKEKVVDFKQVRAVVFDEADRMFDMGFKDDMRYILRRIPEHRQMLLFSATLNLDVFNIAYEFGANPKEIDVSRDQLAASNVEDSIFHVGQGEKPMMLLSVLKKAGADQVIIFSNFKANIARVEHFLNDNGYPALGISSVLTQGQRTRVMEQFKSESGSNILVATDVAARGLDVKGVDLVINYEMPNDAENYVHRIGRTGRAGKEGVAYSLVSDMDVPALARIEEYLGNKMEVGWIDDEDLVKEFKKFPTKDPSMKRSGDSGGRGNKKGGKRGGRSEHRDRSSNRHRQQGSVFEQGEKKSKKKKKHGHKKKKSFDAKDANGSQKKPFKKKKKQQGKKPHQKKSAPQPQQPKSVMQKVSGFFKGLFGK